MHVLVTGGAGYIGSHISKGLATMGLTPVVFDNLTTGHRNFVRWGPLIEGDLCDREALDSVFTRYSIEAVFHLADLASVQDSMAKPASYLRNNTIGMLNLLDAMRKHHKNHLIFSSSCATYGIAHTPRIAENHPQNPINPYGESKLIEEKFLRWYGTVYDIRWVTLRYFNAGGADLAGEIGEKHDPEQHLIPCVIRAALGCGPAVGVCGTDFETPDGTAIRDYVHVTDIADAHLRALKYLQSNGESVALNLGKGEGNSVREVMDCVEEVANKKIPMHVLGRRDGDPAILIANSSKIRQVLSWQPTHSALKTIVETAWAWHSAMSSNVVT
jgi:UDP-arabinose 4-epimerase